MKSFRRLFGITFSIVCISAGQGLKADSATPPGLRLLESAPPVEGHLADPLVYWSETRTTPRALTIHFVRLDLTSKDYELITIPSADPDGPGPYEATLEMPAVLMKRSEAIVAVNGSAFQNPNNREDYNWHEGKSVDIHGLIVAGGAIVSPPEAPRASFWVDASGLPKIGTPEDTSVVQASISDWNNLTPTLSGQLIKAGQVCIKPGGNPHPRTAIGFDASGRFVTFAVVDGRQVGYSEGCTLIELAEIMQAAGCAEAINLDGGGSSILISNHLENPILNKPSGQSPRPIPVMIGVREARPTP